MSASSTEQPAMPSSGSDKTMRLALAQILVECGEVARNIERAEAAVRDAVNARADIVVLPEAADLGWAQPLLREEAEFLSVGKAALAYREMARSNGVWVCVGLTERDPIRKDRIYNAAILIDRDGEIQLHHRKINELEFACEIYTTGNRLAVAGETEFGCLGLMICADAFVGGRVISRSLGQMGARLILSPCAWAVAADHDNAEDPYGQLWLDSYRPVAQEFGLWVAGVSNVGFIDAGEWAGRKCIGNSLLIAPDGSTRLQMPYGEAAEALIVTEITVF